MVVIAFPQTPYTKADESKIKVTMKNDVSAPSNGWSNIKIDKIYYDGKEITEFVVCMPSTSLVKAKPTNPVYVSIKDHYRNPHDEGFNLFIQHLEKKIEAEYNRVRTLHPEIPPYDLKCSPRPYTDKKGNSQMGAPSLAVTLDFGKANPFKGVLWTPVQDCRGDKLAKAAVANTARVEYATMKRAGSDDHDRMGQLKAQGEYTVPPFLDTETPLKEGKLKKWQDAMKSELAALEKSKSEYAKFLAGLVRGRLTSVYNLNTPITDLASIPEDRRFVPYPDDEATPEQFNNKKITVVFKINYVSFKETQISLKCYASRLIIGDADEVEADENEVEDAVLAAMSASTSQLSLGSKEEEESSPAVNAVDEMSYTF